jgi:hypothetical protein
VCRVLGIGPKVQTVAAVLFPRVFVEERVRKQLQNLSNAFLVLRLFLAMASLFFGGIE